MHQKVCCGGLGVMENRLLLKQKKKKKCFLVPRRFLSLGLCVVMSRRKFFQMFSLGQVGL
jgi:hypothetical protein